MEICLTTSQLSEELDQQRGSHQSGRSDSNTFVRLWVRLRVEGLVFHDCPECKCWALKSLPRTHPPRRDQLDAICSRAPQCIAPSAKIDLASNKAKKMLKKNILETITLFAKEESVHPLLLLARPEFRQQCISARWNFFVESNLPLLTYKKQRGSSISAESIAEGTIDHNIKGISNSVSSLAMLERSSLLFRPLMSIDSIYDYRCMSAPDDVRILLIGSRTEYEILLSLSYGFREENIFAIDLISYSEYITVADMHELPFADDFFDIVVCGWTLGYSLNPTLALKEMMRVTKRRGYISLGQDAYSQKTSNNQFISAERPRDVDQLLRLFPSGDGHSVLPIYYHNPCYPAGKIEGFLGHLLLTVQTHKKEATMTF